MGGRRPFGSLTLAPYLGKTPGSSERSVLQKRQHVGGGGSVTVSFLIRSLGIVSVKKKMGAVYRRWALKSK